MNFTQYVGALKDGTDLSRIEASKFLGLLLDDVTITEPEIAEALTALTKKSVTPEEVCGFVDSMKARMTRLSSSQDAIDTCGTGGDKSGTFNISTAAAILLAAGGVPVAKHGNRAATSKCGSADVLEALHIPVDLDSEAAAGSLAQHNFVFLFAPLYHPALKRLSIVRKQLGFPTVFNLLGPLLNPAQVQRQVIGTFSLANASLLAEVMQQMEYEHGVVLTSEDGLDEASLASPVRLFEVKGSSVSERSIIASDYGLEPTPVSALQGADAAENAQIITTAFEPREYLNAPQRIIAFNAALGFYVGGKAVTIDEGVMQAKKVLMSGKARDKLQELRDMS